MPKVMHGAERGGGGGGRYMLHAGGGCAPTRAATPPRPTSFLRRGQCSKLTTRTSPREAVRSGAGRNASALARGRCEMCAVEGVEMPGVILGDCSRGLVFTKSHG